MISFPFVIRTAQTQCRERYDATKKQWEHYPNTAEAAMHSRRITEAEAREMAKKDGIPLDEPWFDPATYPLRPSYIEGCNFNCHV